MIKLHWDFILLASLKIFIIIVSVRNLSSFSRKIMMTKIIAGSVIYFCLLLLVFPILYKKRNSKYYTLYCVILGFVTYFLLKILTPGINLTRYVFLLFFIVLGALYFYEWIVDRKFDKYRDKN